jgi:AcrR family transcriptional regulator
MKRRAEQVEQTRLRITQAAVELHGTVGPARTTISAVAELAGVERLTVYRHFHDEHALFQACTSHWLTENPFPDPQSWSSVEDPLERLSAGLGELYAWYRRTEPMMANFFRDAPSVPALADRAREWEGFADAARRVLVHGFGADGGEPGSLRAAVALALDFHTWVLLTRQGLGDDEAAGLMTRFVAAAVGGSTLVTGVCEGAKA